MPLVEVLALCGADGYRRLKAGALKSDRAERASYSASVQWSGRTRDTFNAQFDAIRLSASPVEHVARVRAQSASQSARDETSALAQVKSLIDIRGPLFARTQAQLDTGARATQ